MTYRPKIGLTMRVELETGRFYLGRDYSEALAGSGASPLHLALIADQEYVDSVLASLDGILLPGSDTDVDPEYYGEDPHKAIGRTIVEKDQTDLMVIEAAERLGIPILGICYGMQVINVARGGSLIQDIESQMPGAIQHRQGKPVERSSHFIELDRTRRFLASSDVNGTTRVKVNSHHHQAIKVLGKDLVATAKTSDGIVEAFEDTRADKFVLGVQWHPELSWRTDDLSRQVFGEFVAACRGYGQQAGRKGTSADSLNVLDEKELSLAER